MKKKALLILIAILVFGLFLRLFKLNQLFHFTMDEALIAFRALGLFRYNRPFLIGGISPLQVHLPPYFYYLAAILLTPFKFNPAGWGIWAAVFSLFTITALYLLTKKLFNQKIALLTSLLYATSFTPVFFDRHFWPLNLNPLLTLLALLLLTKLKQKSPWPYLALGILMAFILTTDPSNIPLILAVVVYSIINLRKLSQKFLIRQYLAAAAVFFVPLLAFDLRHNWQNFSGITKLFQTASQLQFSWPKLLDALLLLPRSLARFWYSPQTDLVKLYSYCIPYADSRQHHLPLALVILAVVILLWFLKQTYQSQKPLLKTIAFLIVFYLLGILLFGALGYSIFDHYLAGLLPIFALLTALFLTQLPKLAKLLLLSVLVITNLYQISQARHPYGFTYKQQLVSWANQELQGQDYALDSISKCHRENGLRYLFELTDNPPKISFMDPNFFWLYQQPPAQTIPDKVLLVTDKPLTTNLPILTRQQFGHMAAYILDNSNHLYQFN